MSATYLLVWVFRVCCKGINWAVSVPVNMGASLLMFVSCTQCQHKALLVLPLLREKNCGETDGR